MNETLKFFKALKDIQHAKFETIVRIEHSIFNDVYEVVFLVPSGNIKLRCVLFQSKTPDECKQFCRWHRLSIFPK